MERKKTTKQEIQEKKSIYDADYYVQKPLLLYSNVNVCLPQASLSPLEQLV